MPIKYIGGLILETLIAILLSVLAIALLIWLLTKFWFIALSIGILLIGGHMLSKDEKNGIKKGKVSSSQKKRDGISVKFSRLFIKIILGRYIIGNN